VEKIQLSERQEQIIKIVKEQGPIKGEEIADILGYVRATLRPDLAVLTRTGLLEARPRVGYYFTGKDTSFRIYEVINKIKVKDMKAVPAVVRETATVYDAIVNLFMMDVGSLFVVSEGGLLEGVVSRKDLLKVSLGQVDIHKVPITVAMNRMPNIVMVEPEESLMLAAKRLMDHEIDSLPVVRSVVYEGKEGFEVVGRITKTTITRAFVELGAGPTLSRQGGNES
jgi:predicted transcriptional regulator